MGEACGIHRTEAKYVNNSGQKACKEEANLKTLAR
jgi:hypothetical protein